MKIENKQLALQYCKNTYLETFGNLDKYYKNCGKNGELYFNHLIQKTKETPDFILHIWMNAEIIGQIEVSTTSSRHMYGSLNHIYIEKNHRLVGLGSQAEKFACDLLKNERLLGVRLSVSNLNLSAINFYKKSGWIISSTQPNEAESILMEKAF